MSGGQSHRHDTLRLGATVLQNSRLPHSYQDHSLLKLLSATLNLASSHQWSTHIAPASQALCSFLFRLQSSRSVKVLDQALTILSSSTAGIKGDVEVMVDRGVAGPADKTGRVFLFSSVTTFTSELSSRFVMKLVHASLVRPWVKSKGTGRRQEDDHLGGLTHVHDRHVVLAHGLRHWLQPDHRQQRPACMILKTSSFATGVQSPTANIISAFMATGSSFQELIRPRRLDPDSIQFSNCDRQASSCPLTYSAACAFQSQPFCSHNNSMKRP